MYLTGVAETTSKRFSRVIRGAGLALPILFTAYAFLILGGIVDTTSGAISTPLVGGIGGIWIVTGLLQVLHPSRTKLSSFLRFTFNHLAAMVFLIFIVGFGSPLVYTWAILVVGTYVYFGSRGMIVSMAMLLLAYLLEAYLYVDTFDQFIANFFAVLTTILIGGLAAASMHSANVDQADVDSSHQQALLEKHRIMALINNITDAIISTDGNGTIRTYNSAMLNLLDTNTELEGRSIDTVLQLASTSGEKVELFDELRDLATVKMRDDVVMEISGESTRLEITMSPIRGSFNRGQQQLDGFIVIARDVTKEKSLDEERDEFISVVSHELRTPITIAEGTISNLQLMLARGKTTGDTARAAVDGAYDQILYLASMVNDLSTLSRAERGVADDNEQINIEELIHDFYNEYLPEAAAKDLALNLHVPARPGTVNTSRLYLKELLQNFITNAIKYTKEGSVDITTRRNTADNTITISVKDSGIGISKIDQKHIYDRFYRSEDYRTRETGGTGLGLYVAMKLAKKVGTKIELKSRLNHGSTFSITLPLVDAAPKKSKS